MIHVDLSKIFLKSTQGKVMSTPVVAPVQAPADIFKQLAQLLLQPLVVTSLPIIANALSQFGAAGSDPIALTLVNNSLISNLAANLVSVKNEDIAALVQVANAAVTAIGTKLSAAPVTAAGVGASLAAQIQNS
jgi:hypothetical protein